nr:hypothetical protein [Tanacetum cinerariifolium]
FPGKNRSSDPPPVGDSHVSLAGAGRAGLQLRHLRVQLVHGVDAAALFSAAVAGRRDGHGNDRRGDRTVRPDPRWLGRRQGASTLEQRPVDVRGVEHGGRGAAPLARDRDGFVFRRFVFVGRRPWAGGGGLAVRSLRPCSHGGRASRIDDRAVQGGGSLRPCSHGGRASRIDDRAVQGGGSARCDVSDTGGVVFRAGVPGAGVDVFQRRCAKDARGDGGG